MNEEAILPLLSETPQSWVEIAMSDRLALLNDHAHLEKKAATNALELLLRWPDKTPPEKWVQAMTAIANDEVGHLQTVLRHLGKRGGTFERVHRNAYAGELHRLVRYGKAHLETVDRLLVSALIEARSCERFMLLGSSDLDDEPLAKLYDGLYLSEAGHYRVFLQLAEGLPEAFGVAERWQELLEAEGEIIGRQPPGPSMHSGW